MYEKIRRANSFHFASRLPRVFRLLQQAGYTDEVRAEGGKLLIDAVLLLRQRNADRVVDGDLIERCENYRRRWFPAVRATLDRFYPAFVEPFFRELAQLDGKQAPLAVLEFLGTLERLARGEAPFGDKGPEARQLLVSRMLTAEVEAQGHALIEEWERTAAIVPTDSKRVEAEAAIEALWKWRMEWSRHARILIQQKELLRELGMGRRKTAGGPDDDDLDEDDETLALSPSVTTPEPSVAAPGAGDTPSDAQREVMAPATFAAISIPIGSPSLVPGK